MEKRPTDSPPKLNKLDYAQREVPSGPTQVVQTALGVSAGIVCTIAFARLLIELNHFRFFGNLNLLVHGSIVGGLIGLGIFIRRKWPSFPVGMLIGIAATCVYAGGIYWMIRHS